MPWKRYTYHNPAALPLSGDEVTYQGDYDKLVMEAGFNPADEEVGLAVLAEEWNGHPAGALVVTDIQVEGSYFAVLTDED